MHNFLEKYNHRVATVNSLVCVGLDSELSRLPAEFQQKKYPQFEFNTWIIEQTHEFVAAYKPNAAFYEAQGDKGIQELKLTVEYLQANYCDIPIILDAKRGDIESTNQGYVKFAFDWLGVDAITLHPYLGKAALQPFLEREDKGCIILCKTSNKNSNEFQDLIVDTVGTKMWEQVAQQVAQKWNEHGNCLLVVGATYPNELKRARELTGEMTFLVPGLGVQGGECQATVTAGINSSKAGLIMSASRSIIFASNPKQAAAHLQQEINQYR